ncbi:MAG: hypothetical protein IT260_04835 [Saprospiraceae bacterium]|nr:hypothetical protein [Saprospiraceae bacterium]
MVKYSGEHKKARKDAALSRNQKAAWKEAVLFAAGAARIKINFFSGRSCNSSKRILPLPPLLQKALPH